MQSEIIWAPWRINYIREIEKDDGCFICKDLENTSQDNENFVLWRTDLCIVILNRFPYNNGHLLIAPSRHIPDFEQATDEEMLQIMKLVRESQKALTAAVQPHGFNVGINFGRCAGAGLPGHIHIHVVPRWNGDTNFMPVCSKTDVISQSLSELLDLLKQKSKELNLPKL